MSAASRQRELQATRSRSSRSSAERTAPTLPVASRTGYAGDVDGPEHLIARAPDAHRRNGIDLRMRTEVEKIDLAAGRVLAHDLAAGWSFWEGFDSLVIATGAVPERPPRPGADAVGVFGVQL